MWRSLLVLWLTTTIFAGSSLCCCTAAVLGIATSTESAASCCCEPSSDETSGCPRDSDGRKHECPCKKSPVVVADVHSERVMLPTLSTSGVWLLSTVNVIANVPFDGVLPVDARRLRPSAFPYLDGRGILRAVNTLRC